MDWKHLHNPKYPPFPIVLLKLGIISALPLLSLLSDCTPGQCESLPLAKDWQNLNDEGTYLYKRGQYSSAAESLTKAMEAARQSGETNQQFATSLYVLGCVAFAQQRFDEARALFEKSLTIRQRVLWPDHPELAQSYHTFARLQEALGQYDQAASLYLRELEIKERLFPADHPEIRRTVSDLAAYFRAHNVGAKSARLELLLRLLKLEEADPSTPLFEIATLSCEIGGQYKYANKPDLAEKYIRKGMALEEKDPRVPPRCLADTMLDLAIVLVPAKPKEAETLLLRLVKLDEKGFPAADDHLALAFFTLGCFYKDTGRAGESENMLKQSLALRIPYAGTNEGRQRTIDTLKVMGGLYSVQQRWQDCQQVYTRAFQLASESGVNNRRQADEFREELARIARLMEKVSVVQDVSPPSSELDSRDKDELDTAAALFHSAEQCLREHKEEEAEKHLKRCLAIREKVLGPRNKLVADTLFTLAQSYHSRGMVSDAESLYKKALDIASGAHCDLATRANYEFFLANLYYQKDQTSKYPQAIELYLNYIAAMQELYGHDHPAQLGAIVALADIYRKEKKYPLAEKYYKVAIDLARKSDTPDKDYWLNNALKGYRDVLGHTSPSAPQPQ